MMSYKSTDFSVYLLIPGILCQFAKIATPLHALLKKENAFEWTSECTTTFNLLIDALTSPPVLVYPEFGLQRGDRI